MRRLQALGAKDSEIFWPSRQPREADFRCRRLSITLGKRPSPGMKRRLGKLLPLAKRPHRQSDRWLQPNLSHTWTIDEVRREERKVREN